MPILDGQLAEAFALLEDLALPGGSPSAIASTIRAEIASVPDADARRVCNELPIKVGDYLQEMTAFQAWMDLAHQNSTNPAVVRAQVMTNLYVAFVWLRDSLLAPLRKLVADDSVTATLIDYLKVGDRRRLRNAVAHGRWRYGHEFTHLECWDGQPPSRFTVQSVRLGALQTMSRGLSIAVLLALSEL